MRFPFLSKSTETAAASASASTSAWPWPACVNNPRTPSFRANTNAIYRTMNSAFVDDDDKIAAAETLSETSDSFFSIRGGDSFSSESAVVRGLRSDRLFFEPGETNSILEEAKSAADFPFQDSAALMAMDSTDPYLDFRASMEEMVAAHGLSDWDQLEDLLAVYLRVNQKCNHGYIVGAFVDLLLHLAVANDDENKNKNNNNSNSKSNSSAIDEQCSSSSTATQYSFTSPLSFSSSTCSSISPCSSGV